MDSRLTKQPRPLLLCGAVLLCAGCMGTAAEQVTDTATDHAGTETDQEHPTPPESRAPPTRRLRASMAMPYFSFAQLLRPRS
ncbi:MAG: hypothetical protein QM581_16770 [Pseudomonas sp.]